MMPKVRGIIIDFIDKSQYYYKAGNAEESRTLHKIYELLKGCANAQNAAITSIAIAAGCNNGNEYHIHHGKTGVLLETLSEMLAVLFVKYRRAESYRVLVHRRDARVSAGQAARQAKKEPSQMRGQRRKNNGGSCNCRLYSNTWRTLR